MTTSSDPCPGHGKCHGCLKWCPDCDDVSEVCDARCAGEDCPDHPMPPSAHELAQSRHVLETRKVELTYELAAIVDGLERVTDLQRTRRILDRQMAEAEALEFGRKA